jgi:two-component system, OmpR family, sensor histidine kinase KdpD
MARDITDVIKQFHITQVISGQSAKTRFEELTKGSIENDIMRLTSGIDIHNVSASKKQ